MQNKNQNKMKNQIHIRRCHICDTITESEQALVSRCSGCQKSLAPFVFCETTYQFEMKELSQTIFKKSNQGLKSIYPPLLGIALYW